jgi:hypothetical protein
LKLNEALSGLSTEQIPKITELLLENRDEDFKALQRIFEGVTEGLRDEIILLRRLMVETEERWQRESNERFMAAIDRDRLMKRFEELEKSLRERGEGIRSELLTSLETTLERIREENVSTGQLTEALRTDFTHFREDAASLVERRVNDKFSFVLELLDRLNKKTEQLALVWTSAKPSFAAAAVVGKSGAKKEEPVEGKDLA